MGKQTEERVYIGMGSNLDDPLGQLKRGLRGMEAMEGFRLLKVSSPYQSAPVGVTDQPLFVNAVAHGIFKGEAERLLDRLLAIEKQQGRERLIRWGPRTLDLDLLLFGEHMIDLPRLKVPHPEMHRRAFVLAPLMELNPGLILPGWKKSAEELLDAMDPDERAAQTLDKIAWDS